MVQSDSEKVVTAARNSTPPGIATSSAQAFRRLVIALTVGSLLASVLAVRARAQGVRYDNIVLGPRGTPVAGAQIAVCTSAAVRTTTPCSPLAQVYSDQALSQPMANPFPADSLGNYGFWAQPGHYVVQIYGTGVTTRSMDVFLSCDPSNCSMTSATFSSITAGTLNLTGALTVNGRDVATEPTAADAVQYVSPSGNDSSDGLSWGTAKQTIYAAWNAIIAANPRGGPSHEPGGTIYVAANSACGGPVAGQGLWIMGDADPNWNGGDVPSGWLIYAPMRVIGVGQGGWVSGGPVPSVPVSCGSGASANLPALWISGVGSPLEFDNLYFNSSEDAYQAARLGIDSNGARNTNSGATSVTFQNDQFGPSSNAAGGPTVDIGSNSFEDYFYNNTIQADDATPGGTDQHQAMVINGGGGGCVEPAVTIRNMHLGGGGIKYYTTSCENGGVLDVDGLLTENQNDGKGAVWLTAENRTGFYSIQNVLVADSSPGSPDIEVDQETGGTLATPDSLTTNSGLAPGVPGIFTGGEDITTIEPSASSQFGFADGKVWGQSDAARRLFGMVESPWQNLAPFDPAAWTNTTETKVTDPTGTMWAGQATGVPIFEDLTQTLSAGDFIVIGAWYRVPSKTGLSGSWPISVGIPGGGCGAQIQPIDKSSAPAGSFPVGRQGAGGDGQWTWVSAAFVVTTSGTSCDVRFSADWSNATTGIIYYAPVLYYIPGSSVNSYSEVADVATHLAPYVGSGLADSTLPGHPIAFGGSGDNYLAMLDHTALTSNQTYTLPGAGGTVGVVVGQTTVAGPTATISPGACASTVTTPVSGVTTTTVILAAPNADPAAANYKSLVVHWFPTAGNVNLEVCNPSASSVTPTALTFNVRAIE